MNVKNISLNCQKPRHFGNSAIAESSVGTKKRYKRYDELDNDTLMLKSILKAHESVKQGSKMKMFKAMPKITAGIIGTTLAITQPGKLSSKINYGLGFLVATGLLFGFSNKIEDFANKNLKEDSKQQNPLKTALVKTGFATVGSVAATYAVLRGGSKAVEIVKNSSTKLAEILQQDATKLVDDIDSSKLGKFVQDTFIPFETRNADKLKKAKNIMPLAAVATGVIAQAKLRSGIIGDIKEKTQINFLKGKLIQQQAREQYESIDATEA